MKRNIFIAGLASIALIGCSEKAEIKTTTDENVPEVKNEYTINADFTGVDISKAYLSVYTTGQWENLDSTEVVDGKFSFTGTVASPEVQYIKFDGKKEYIPLFIENSEISVTGTSLDHKEVEVKGSAIHEKMESFNNEVEVFYAQMKELTEKYYAADEAGDQEAIAAIDEEYMKVSEEQDTFIKQYIADNSSSVIAPYLTVSHLLSRYSASQIDSVLGTFPEELSDSKYIVKMKERYDILKITEVGATAPAFVQTDAEGQDISLEDFKGKYVLVDFWASWCGPCRKENPNVVEAYSKFHDKGFEILGVSLDSKKENWLEAIESDQLTWVHVSDLKGWGNEVAQLYGVNSIPHSILIDPDGVIVAKNLRGEELHNKLEEVLAEI